jgi:hypothetical protein
LAVSGVVLAVAGTSLAGQPSAFERVHYFVWFAPDALGAFAPNGPCPEPDDPGFAPPTDAVAGGCIADPDDPRMLVAPNQNNLAQAVMAASPFALAADDDVLNNETELAEIALCFPSPEPYEGGCLIHTAADGTITVQINLHGLSLSGGNKLYNLLLYVHRVDDAAGVRVAPEAGWDPLDIPKGETYTFYLGAWELHVGTGKITSGCQAVGDLSNNPYEETAIKIRRFTANEELLQRGETDPPADIGSISGSVTMSSGAPARKVPVELYDDGGSVVDSTKTNPQGKYSFDAVPDGTYSVMASAEGEVGLYYGVTVSNGAAVTGIDIVTE